MIIKGTVYPIGELNKNRWGIPDEEDVVSSVIESLKTSKIKICPTCTGENEHHCDFNDTGTEVGNILDVYRDENNIDIIAEITNDTAKENFLNGTWGKTWSPYGIYDTIDEEGFVHGKFENKYVTFVNQPAWSVSKNNELYASETKEVRSFCELSGDDENQSDISEPSSSQKILEDENNIIFASSFNSSSSDNNFENFGDTMSDENNVDEQENIEENIEENKEDVIDYKSLYESEKMKNDELNTSIEELNIMKENSIKEKIEEKIDNNIPEDKVQDIVNNAILAERERVSKEFALDEYKNICKSVGIEFKESDISRFNDTKFTAEDIKREGEIIKSVAQKSGVKFSPGKEPKYPSDDKNKKTPEQFMNQKGWTVGKYNFKTKQYEI